MLNVHFVLTLIALICFFCAAIGKPSGPVSLGWLGLFFWALDLLIRGS